MTHTASPLGRRRAGLLLHPTSLPGGTDNGELGPEAFRFIDFMVESGFSVWQTLPLGPTHEDGSPYQSLSVHAGNPNLISIEALVRKGWLDEVPQATPGESPHAHREACLREALARLNRNGVPRVRQAWERFRRERADWLEDYALYRVLRIQHGKRPWPEWPTPLRDREPKALAAARAEFAEEIEAIAFKQFVFFDQWHDLREYAHKHDVLLFGDMPIFVAHDSAEVWAHREYFLLNDQGQPRVVAGVPPDYFSETGQLWGNPHYDWARMQDDGFDWWVRRMRTQLEIFDWVRIDHFRGFEAYWEVSADAETAIEGRWVQAPGAELLDTFYRTFDALPVIAEDLGTITPEVIALLDQFGLPGMKVLQFAFGGGADNPYLPHNHEENGVVYTGTHDNDTTLGWYEGIARHERDHLHEYLGHPGEPMPWPFNRAALASVARLAILPMQDILGLGAGHRMNTPGTMEGNWDWRFAWDQVPHGLAERMRRMNEMYERCCEVKKAGDG